MERNKHQEYNPSALRRRPPGSSVSNGVNDGTSNGVSHSNGSNGTLRTTSVRQGKKKQCTRISMVVLWLIVVIMLLYGSILLKFIRTSLKTEQKDASQKSDAAARAPTLEEQVASLQKQYGVRRYEKPESGGVTYTIRRAKDAELDTSKTTYPLLSIRDLLKDYKVQSTSPKQETQQEYTLRAFLEPVFQKDWEIQPLPIRNTTASTLGEVQYPHVNSCTKLLEQFPVNDDCPTVQDPFLPWIHDVFPTHDGKFVQFVAQNKRRCRTGKYKKADRDALKHYTPQAALFQHVPIQRIENNLTTRYRLTTHKEADEDGAATRFICRFKPTLEETLSVHNFNYEYLGYRKQHKQLFTKAGRDLNSLYTSQLLFQCPVPPSLVERVRRGASVLNDYATLFVDVIPIRTPPRYGLPESFLPPRYKQHQNPNEPFDPIKEWGTNHVLPLIEDSGRWENIPICQPSLPTYQPHLVEKQETLQDHLDKSAPEKHHRLIGCVWASASYTTRGERFRIEDGQRRLKEWLTFHFHLGFDHFYIYDNSGANNNSNSTTLKPVTDMFSSRVTRIPWSAKVCNNRPNNVDNPGERSSQYAAEASCKLRFGPHAEWLGVFDIDEYLVPMGNYTNILDILTKLESEKKKIISFASWRSWPRKTLIEDPVPIKSKDICEWDEPCFELKVPPNHTFLQTFNCDRQKGQKKQVMPAEKQLFKPEYVKLHFVHYSVITELTQLSKEETLARGLRWQRRINEDPASRFSNELDEATMLHTKAIATPDTVGWQTACKHNQGFCRIGNPFPPGAYEANITEDAEGWSYNCHVNEKIEDYWVPKLVSMNPFL